MLKSKAGRLPDSWNGINYYGYKNSICIDVDHSFIRLYAVTPANVHESQMLPHLIDPENKRTYAWADSAYSGEYLESLLSLGGLENLIHGKGNPIILIVMRTKSLRILLSTFSAISCAH